jgi:hypothetical protein
MDAYSRERIENWASDFAGRDAARGFPAPCGEWAAEVAATFLAAAAESAGSAEEVGEADVRKGLLAVAGKGGLPPEVAPKVPDLCAAFLEDLEAEGRLAGGAALGRFARACRPAYDAAAGTSRAPHRRPSAKLSPNEPCPCGSGAKYKRCCG